MLLDWRRAVPKTTSGIAQQFSAEQIGLFVKAKKELGLKSKVPDILIAHNGGSDGAAMVSLAGMPEFVGVLQPVKQHIAVLAGLHTTAPAWACNPVLAPVVPTDDYCDLA